MNTCLSDILLILEKLNTYDGNNILKNDDISKQRKQNLLLNELSKKIENRINVLKDLNLNEFDQISDQLFHIRLHIIDQIEILEDNLNLVNKIFANYGNKENDSNTSLTNN